MVELIRRCRPHERRPRRSCHYRAIHSSLDRSATDTHGQGHGGRDLRRLSSAQVVIFPDLALQAGGLPRLYIAIVADLGLYFVIGAIAWTTFIYRGIAVPDSFTTILATIAGGSVGVLAPTGGQARSSPPSREQRPPAE
jgi:hypothetical protein